MCVLEKKNSNVLRFFYPYCTFSKVFLCMLGGLSPKLCDQIELHIELGINENMHLSLSFAPNMTKIFNQVQNICQYEVWSPQVLYVINMDPQAFFLPQKHAYIEQISMY